MEETKISYRIHKKNKKNIHLALFFLFFVCVSQANPNYSFGLSKNKTKKAFASTEEFLRGVVVSKNPIASQLGSKILEQGGNAIDAAITTGYALGVVEPNGSGIGGGGFALIYLAKSKQIKAIDFRARAPIRIKTLTRGNFLSGPKASGIPGTVKGLEYLRKNYGTKTRAELIDPVISVAKKGIPVNRTLQKGIIKKQEVLKKYPSSRQVYLSDLLKEPPGLGEILKQLDLAGTLEKIRDGGWESFYLGEIADSIVIGNQSYGGIIGYEDLEAYRVFEREVICGLYRGEYKICSFPPPSSGAVSLIEALNILENFNLGSLSYKSPRRIYYLTEALKFVFEDRSENLGDPDFNRLNFYHLLSKNYAQALAKEIRKQELMPKKTRKSRKTKTSLNSVFLENRETSHYTVVDKEGNIASVTLSLNGPLGSAFVVPETGILLNNTLNDFSFPQRINRSTVYNFGLADGKINYPAPLKTPLSSMSPTIVFDNPTQEPILALGAPGGPTIISAILNVLVNYLDHKMSLEEAVLVGRVHHQSKPDHVYYEEKLISPTVKKYLKKKYNYVFPEEENKIWKDFYWSVQAVELNQRNKRLKGVSDPRSEQGLFYERNFRYKRRNNNSS